MVRAPNVNYLVLWLPSTLSARHDLFVEREFMQNKSSMRHWSVRNLSVG